MRDTKLLADLPTILTPEVVALLKTLKGLNTPTYLTNAWPVGSYYLSDANVNPAVRLGFGTWQLVGQGQLNLI